MRTNSGTAPADLILGERVAAAVEEAVQNDPKAYGYADGEETEALRALSTALSDADDFGSQIAVLMRAERSAREMLRSSEVPPGADLAPTA